MLWPNSWYGVSAWGVTAIQHRPCLGPAQSNTHCMTGKYADCLLYDGAGPPDLALIWPEAAIIMLSPILLMHFLYTANSVAESLVAMHACILAHAACCVQLAQCAR